MLYSFSRIPNTGSDTKPPDSAPQAPYRRRKVNCVSSSQSTLKQGLESIARTAGSASGTEEDLTMMSMETMSRRLVDNALSAARKWLKDDASACYCGLATDVEWLRAVGRGHQLDGDTELWWRVEAHLRRCLNMGAEEIGELMSSNVLKDTRYSTSKESCFDNLRNSTRCFKCGSSKTTSTSSGHTEYLELHSDRKPVPFPIRIHVEIPKELWLNHLQRTSTVKNFRSTANFTVDCNGELQATDIESDKTSKAGEIFV